MISILFVCYIIFVTLIVMNVMTGIFCESAIEAAQGDREQLVSNQLKEREKYVAELTAIFNQWDTSGDGDISLREFEDHLSDRNIQAMFETLGIGTEDAWDFFKLLDKDGQGLVDLDNFVEGCIRLRGAAKAFHIRAMEYQFRWMMNQVTQIGLDVGRLLERVERKAPSILPTGSATISTTAISCNPTLRRTALVEEPEFM